MADIHPAEQRRDHMMLTIRDVAAELGCGRDTVYRLLASGQLPSVLISDRLRRVRRSDLLAFIEALAASRPVPAVTTEGNDSSAGHAPTPRDIHPHDTAVHVRSGRT